jgi:hypothetical protein
MGNNYFITKCNKNKKKINIAKKAKGLRKILK